MRSKFALALPMLWMLLAIPLRGATGDKIVWMGCGISRLAFMEALATAYTEATGLTFRMAGGGATKGIRLTAIGRSDVGGSCRPQLRDRSGAVVPEEEAVQMIHVGWDALVPIVHRDNPVSDISRQDLEGIFRGSIRDWGQLGGKPGEIDILVRSGKISGVGHMFRLLVLGDPDADYPKNAKEFESSGPLEENIETRFVRGIGITGVSSARKRSVNVLTVDGVAPTKENIAAGAYPFFRPLFMVVGRNPKEEVKAFVDFVLSDEGQTLISREGTVNLAEGKELEERWQLSDLGHRSTP